MSEVIARRVVVHHKHIDGTGTSTAAIASLSGRDAILRLLGHPDAATVHVWLHLSASRLPGPAVKGRTGGQLHVAYTPLVHAARGQGAPAPPSSPGAMDLTTWRTPFEAQLGPLASSASTLSSEPLVSLRQRAMKLYHDDKLRQGLAVRGVDSGARPPAAMTPQGRASGSASGPAGAPPGLSFRTWAQVLAEGVQAARQLSTGSTTRAATRPVAYVGGGAGGPSSIHLDDSAPGREPETVAASQAESDPAGEVLGQLPCLLVGRRCGGLLPLPPAGLRCDRDSSLVIALACTGMLTRPWAHTCAGLGLGSGCSSSASPLIL